MTEPRVKELTFTSDKLGLENILDDIRKGVIQLPDFQRDWVWDDQHIRDLIESISLSYPIGMIMLLETGGKTVHFKTRPIEGAPIPEEDAENLILDGQQRLTSLYQALYTNYVVHTRDFRKKPVNRWYFINMELALKSNGDRSDAIISLGENKAIKNFRGEVQEDYSTAEKEYQAGLFPLGMIFNCSAWRKEYHKYWKFDAKKVELFDEFEEEVIERFTQYQIPTIYIKKQTPKDAVCQVFEKVNTGGVSLTVFELLTATFAAEDFLLREDWEARSARMKERKLLSSFQNTDFLQAIALLVTYKNRLDAINAGMSEDKTPGISCKRKEILKLSKEDYQTWADKVEQGFMDAARFLYRQHIFSGKDLPYRTQVVPLAAALVWLGREAESDGAQQKLARWYWSGVLGELYGSAVESRFARDLPEIVDWTRDLAAPPKAVEDATFSPARLYTLRTRNSAAYKGIHALLMRQGGLDFRTGQTIEEQMYFEDSVDIHHIFPYDWCEKNKVNAGQRDCIVNKTPLSARTNRSIGANAPTVYLDHLQKDAGINAPRMDTILRTHQIDPIHLRANDFAAFFKARADGLLNLIEGAMGKTILREVRTEETDLVDYEGTLAEDALA